MNVKCPKCGSIYNKDVMEKDPSIGAFGGDLLFCETCSDWIHEYRFIEIKKK